MRKAKVGDIVTNGSGTFKLLKIGFVNKKRNCIVGIHEQWHKWINSKQDWTKTPSFYSEVNKEK